MAVLGIPVSSSQVFWGHPLLSKTFGFRLLLRFDFFFSLLLCLDVSSLANHNRPRVESWFSYELALLTGHKNRDMKAQGKPPPRNSTVESETESIKGERIRWWLQRNIFLSSSVAYIPRGDVVSHLVEAQRRLQAVMDWTDFRHKHSMIIAQNSLTECFVFSCLLSGQMVATAGGVAVATCRQWVLLDRKCAANIQDSWKFSHLWTVEWTDQYIHW